MSWNRCLAVPVVFLAIALFWLNEPVPPNTADPMKFKAFAALLKVHKNFAKLQSWWTQEDYRLVENRHLRNLLIPAAEYMRKDHPEIIVTEETIGGVPCYIYQTKSTKKDRPGLVYYHGGGFVFGHPASYEPLLFKFVKELGAVVIAPEYSKSPTVKVPVHHDECLEVAMHFFTNAAKYGVDERMIGVAGDSAGGNLAATRSLLLRDKGGFQFVYQLLIYPGVQVLDLQTPSYQTKCDQNIAIMKHDVVVSYFGSFLGLPQRLFPDLMKNKHIKPETWDKYKKYFNLAEISQYGIQNYKPVRPKLINKALADSIESHITNPYLYPLMADDLSGLPPAYVLAVENDPLRDECIWYANRLKRAGNKVLLDVSTDGFHGMIGLLAPPLDFSSALNSANNMVKFAQRVMQEVKANQKV